MSKHQEKSQANADKDKPKDKGGKHQGDGKSTLAELNGDAKRSKK